MAKKDPEIAAAKMALAAASDSMDGLLEKDPNQLNSEELAALLDVARRERALWELKQQRKGKGSGSGTNEAEDKNDDDE